MESFKNFFFVFRKIREIFGGKNRIFREFGGGLVLVRALDTITDHGTHDG
jgi:hypothetical protein